jgi:hypothetical protein
MKAGIALVTAVVALALGLGITSTSSTASTARAPRACTQAIHEARVYGYLAAQGVTIDEQLVPLIRDAAVAGSNQDAAGITRIAQKLGVINGKISRLAKTIGVHADRFNSYAAGCQ